MRPFSRQDAARLRENPLDVRLAFEARLHPGAVDLLVGLRARRPDGGAAAAVEELELEAGFVDRRAHQAAERVDLADEVTLRRAADGGIARHVGDRPARQRAQADAVAQARRGIRGFAAGVTRADDDRRRRSRSFLTHLLPITLRSRRARERPLSCFNPTLLLPDAKAAENRLQHVL